MSTTSSETISIRISAKLAAFHLDKLVDCGLLARRYDLLGEFLVDALVHPGPTRDPTGVARQLSWDRGHRIGEEARSARRLRTPGPERTLALAEELLDQHGYEPASDGPDGLVLRNCPFHTVMKRAPELVCSLNAALIDGLLRGLGNQSVRAELRPSDGACCVRVIRLTRDQIRGRFQPA